MIEQSLINVKRQIFGLSLFEHLGHGITRVMNGRENKQSGVDSTIRNAEVMDSTGKDFQIIWTIWERLVSNRVIGHGRILLSNSPRPTLHKLLLSDMERYCMRNHTAYEQSAQESFSFVQFAGANLGDYIPQAPSYLCFRDRFLNRKDRDLETYHESKGRETSLQRRRNLLPVPLSHHVKKAFLRIVRQSITPRNLTCRFCISETLRISSHPCVPRRTTT